MNIDFEKKNKGVLFPNVRYGEVFIHDLFVGEETICMKINSADESINAVSLSDGDTLCFDDDDIVFPVGYKFQVIY